MTLTTLTPRHEEAIVSQVFKYDSVRDYSINTILERWRNNFF